MKEFKIMGRVDGCPVWEITKHGDTYTMTNGYLKTEYDNLRLPLELLHKSIGANVWKDTLKDAAKILGGQGTENWSKDELVEYLMKF